MIRVLSFCLLLVCHSVTAKTLLVLGDSLSAGYQMAESESWPALLNNDLQEAGTIEKLVNASISGDTTGNGLERLPGLLEQHNPDWVLIELGANDGLRGWHPVQIRRNLKQLITLSRQSGARVLLMQIQIPPNYGQRYSNAFAGIYPDLNKDMQIPLLPFFMEEIVTAEGWLMEDGLHPTPAAQPWIAGFVGEHISPYLLGPQ